jgi:hypothetical protein
MDARLQQAIEHANYRQTLAVERQRLKDKAVAELVMAHNGGLFTVGRELISFINSIKDHKTAVILDDNEYPVDIEDLEEFYNKILVVYFETTNRYLTDYNQVRQKRTAAKLVDL